MMATNARNPSESSSSDALESARNSADAPVVGPEAKENVPRRILPSRLPLSYKLSQRNYRELFEQGFAQTADPWSSYVKLSQTHQAGPAVLAYHSLPPSSVRVVKEVKFPSATIPQRFIRPSHPNVVSLIEIFISNNSFYMVYESMAASLAQIPAKSWEEVTDADVAFVCREVICSATTVSTLTSQKVLQGLTYIHSDLGLSYGQFGPDDILLSASGQVKLGA